MKRAISVLVVGVLLVAPSSAFAECKWLLWGQDMRPWGKGLRLLNILPGPTYSAPYILKEYPTQSDCINAKLKSSQAEMDSWKFPETQKAIEEFGGLPRVSYFACIPLPLKPERINAGEWK